MLTRLACIAALSCGFAAAHDIVIYGVSSAVQSYWSGQFGTDITAKGFTVAWIIDTGRTCEYLADHWETSGVVGHAPRFVVIGCYPLDQWWQGLYSPNDGISGFGKFRAGLKRMVDLVRSIGAIPVVSCIQPAGHYQQHKQNLQIYADVEAWGVAVMDHYDGFHRTGGTSDGGGPIWGYLTSPNFSTDGSHPDTAEARARLSEAIPLTLFDKADSTISATMNSGSWRLAANDSSTDPISVDLDRDTSSFTIAARVKDGQVGTRTYMSVTKSGGNTWAVDGSGGYYRCTATGMTPIVSSVAVSNTSWHHIALSYAYSRNVVECMVDGVSVGTATPTQGYARQFVFGGAAGSSASNATGVQYQDLTIHRAAFDGDVIKLLNAEQFVRRSVDAWFTLSATPPTIANSADTTTAATVNGTWTQTGARPAVLRTVVGGGTVQ